jgi:two-component system phosphate regulon sensor histidine kinase PhoR
MSKTRFRLLVFFMSLSLIGIILVQLYWMNSTLKGNSEQFKFNVQQVLSRVTGQLKELEKLQFFELYSNIKEKEGRRPVPEDFKNYRFNSNGKLVLNGAAADEGGPAFFGNEVNSGELARMSAETRMHDQLLYEAFTEKIPIEQRITVETIRQRLGADLRQIGVDTDFEFAIYQMNDKPTAIKSENFKWDEEFTESHPIFDNLNTISKYRLLVSFPKKDQYLFQSLIGITLLSVIFTLIIIIAYLSAINQLIKQKQISEIKTDFINNMTHEFKTPIATINLALDAMKNPKVSDDKEKMQRYLQMIRDENKRMHAQVENVLQISKLDKRELDIVKEQADIHQIIENAIEHVHLIIEARQGSLTRHFHAQRTTALLNDVHFTNVIVNILDNAIKYSPDEPLIDIYTENVKDFIMIKIRDRGLGMSKTTLKRIFEKFYREHTGDIHNVKGHGLGLAYVKRIIDDHNCHIYVESEKGKGSTFIIKMPLIN